MNWLSGECNLDWMKFVLGKCEERDFEEDSLEIVDVLIRLILWDKIIVVFVLATCGIFLWIKKRD